MRASPLYDPKRYGPNGDYLPAYAFDDPASLNNAVAAVCLSAVLELVTLLALSSCPCFSHPREFAMPVRYGTGG